MLRIKDLVVSYGGVHPVLHKINIDVPKGKIVALLGANGAGKSTTLKAISGLVKPDFGTIELEGKPLNGLTPEKIMKLGVSHVPEGREVFPGLTVEENLKIGAYVNFKKDVVKRNIEQIFTLFPRLAERRNQMAGTMSGGEQQMLVIGRGLMSNPKILMLDEPSLGLAPIIVDGIFDKIEEINKNGTTILLIEQNANIALSVCHYAYVLCVGDIVLSGPSEEITKDKNLMNSYLGGAKGVC